MKNVLLSAVALSLLLSCSLEVASQAGEVATNHPAEAEKGTANDVSRPVGLESGSWPRRLWFFATLASSFDTNINHDRESLRSYGVVPSIGFHFQNSRENPSFEIEYEVGLHRYTNTERWNRVSHNLVTSYKHHLVGPLYMKTEAELTLKGSSEDRELNDQYVLGQQLDYRLNSHNRVQLFAAYRLKRDPIDNGDNAIDPYAGAKFVQRLAGDRRWEISYRYDKNRSWNPRNRYIRWTYGAEFETPVLDRRNHLTFDLTYKPRLYARTVRIEDQRVPRHDQRWLFGVLFERSLRPDLQMALFYKYETRDS